MRLSNWLLSGCAAAASFLAMPAARADIVFCNKFPHTVYIAIAYPQTNGSWLSRGWMSLDTGQCSPFDTALRVKSFYYRAESVSYREGSKTSRTFWGAGDTKFAIWENDNFNYWDAQNRVLKSTLAAFSKGAETDGDAVSATVTFEADGLHTSISIPGPGQ